MHEYAPQPPPLPSWFSSSPNNNKSGSCMNIRRRRSHRTLVTPPWSRRSRGTSLTAFLFFFIRLRRRLALASELHKMMALRANCQARGGLRGGRWFAGPIPICIISSSRSSREPSSQSAALSIRGYKNRPLSRSTSTVTRAAVLESLVPVALFLTPGLLALIYAFIKGKVSDAQLI